MTTTATASSDPPASVSLLDIAEFLLTHRNRLASWTVLAVLVTVLVTLVTPGHYTTTASFIPSSGQSSLGNLAALAGQFGVSVPGEDPTQSPDFYADILTGQPALRAIVGTTYAVADGDSTASVSLVRYYDVSGDTPAEEVDNAVEELRDDFKVTVDATTGTVTIAVRSRHADLAAAIADRALAWVDTFNLTTRRHQAIAERTFIEGRVAEAEQTLRDAEQRLQGFLQRNRDFANSPQLTFEHDRLARDVALRQQLYGVLLQTFEQARIDAVRDTPLITVTEPPVPAPLPDKKYLLLRMALAAFVGLGLAVVWSGIGRVARHGFGSDEQQARVAALSAEAQSQLRSIAFRRGHRASP